MVSTWLKFTAMCAVVGGIVLFCVIFGGYSSFSRSQNRIEASVQLLVDACENRMALLPQIITMAGNDQLTNDLVADLKEMNIRTSELLSQIKPQKNPLSPDLINQFEITQDKISIMLIQFFKSLDQNIGARHEREYAALKIKFRTGQDQLFVAQKRYNKEVAYFNTRTTVFPGFLIARIFGFDAIHYTEFVKIMRTPGEKSFSKAAS